VVPWAIASPNGPQIVTFKAASTSNNTSGVGGTRHWPALSGQEKRRSNRIQRQGQGWSFPISLPMHCGNDATVATSSSTRSPPGSTGAWTAMIAT
jgi:hypothetical protein